MKKLTSLLIACSLALAGAALAQQPVEQQSPAKGKRPPEKTRATEAKPGPNAAKPQERPAKQPGAMKERPGANAQKAETTPKREKAAGTETNVSGQPGAIAAPGGAKGQAGQAQRRSRTRSRCSRLNRSTRTFVRSRSRSKFRRLPSTRIIGFKEANSGRGRNTKYSARIIRNGTIKAGIIRITTVWS